MLDVLSGIAPTTVPVPVEGPRPRRRDADPTTGNVNDRAAFLGQAADGVGQIAQMTLKAPGDAKGPQAFAAAKGPANWVESTGFSPGSFWPPAPPHHFVQLTKEGTDKLASLIENGASVSALAAAISAETGVGGAVGLAIAGALLATRGIVELMRNLSDKDAVRLCVPLVPGLPPMILPAQ